jgi:uncharacterized Fe-S cluster-containing protein
MFIGEANKQDVISSSTVLCKKRAQAQNVHSGEVVKLVGAIRRCRTIDLLIHQGKHRRHRVGECSYQERHKSKGWNLP